MTQIQMGMHILSTDDKTKIMTLLQQGRQSSWTIDGLYRTVLHCFLNEMVTPIFNCVQW